MKPERWHQVREVLHEAMQMDEQERSAFLDSQCASDPSLRAELNQLLAAEGKLGSSFLESPALVHAAVHTDTSETGTVLPAGTKLGPYVVQARIGAGGMGEVYRARDVSLKRDVAIKVLPSFWSRDSERLRRFQLEAEAAAALSHPNILSIYAIGQQNGSPYIVTELLGGETLRDRLRQGTMPLREALDVAIALAKGLAAAHGKGIAHRDLKPENIFLTRDGQVKILDFGLAKLIQGHSTPNGSTLTLPEQTVPGHVLGTVGYMSPEQVRGDAADARSDIFSLGCVLFEMLTGKRAFLKPTSVETMSAILNEDPSAGSEIARNIPPALHKVVNRCLQKAPERRFQSASDVALALVPGREIEPLLSKTEGGFRKKLISASAVAALVLLAGALYPRVAVWSARLIRLSQLQSLTVAPLTSLPGNVASPTFSPNGSQVAFAWDGENGGAGYDLYVKTLGAEEPLRITHHPVARLSAAWSPDGRSIAILRVAEREEPGIYLVPPTGGPERKLTSVTNFSQTTNLSWSPDGQRIAFTDHPQNAPWERAMQLFTLRVDTLDRSEIKTGCTLVTSLAFSPKGDLLAWACVDSWSSFSIHAVRLSDGRINKLFERADGIGGLAWSKDGQRIVFTSPLDFGEIRELSLKRPGYAVNLPVGHDASDIVVDPANGRLAYVGGVLNVNIWRVDLIGPAPHSRKLIVSSREQKAPSVSPNQEKIAFESTRTGSNELWICDADGSHAMQLTSFGIRATGTPRWSPDGKTIAFDSRVAGEANVYLIASDHGVPRKLEIQNVRGNNVPSWSRDGKWIYFVHGEDEHNPSIWKVGSGGGTAVKIASSPATYPAESPDGRYLYFVRGWRLWRSNTDGSAQEEVRGLPELKLLGDKWVPFGAGIYYLADSNSKTELDYFDLTTGKVQRVAALEGVPPLWMGQMSVSTDGHWLVYPQTDERSSNLFTIENWQ